VRARGKLSSIAAAPPLAVRLFKFGKVETTKGTFLFDRKAADSVMSKWNDYGNDLCFDYEHRAVDADARAGDGKAAGWFKLAVRDDGLYAIDVRWTDRAAKEISEREWRYYSPTFDYDNKSGRILELVNVALTNIPATKDLPPLVAAKRDAMKAKAKKTAPRAALAVKSKKMDDAATDDADLDDTATDDDGGDGSSDGATLDDDASLDDAATDDADLDDTATDDLDDADLDDDGASDDDAPPAKTKKTAKSGRASMSVTERAIRAVEVMNKQNAQLNARLMRIERKAHLDRVGALIDSAIAAGKATPAERETLSRIGMLDTKLLRTNLAQRVQVLQIGRVAAQPDVNAAEVANLAQRVPDADKVIRLFGNEARYDKAAKDGTLGQFSSFAPMKLERKGS